MKNEHNSILAGLTCDLYHNLFDYTSVGMAVVALDGKFLIVNDSVSRITGYSRDELLQKSFQEFTHPDDLRENLVLIRRLLNGEINRYDMEKRYVHKDGHFVCNLLAVSLARTEKGEPHYFIAQIQDISEKKKVESELNQKKWELRSVLNNTQTVITRMDREYRHLYVNSAIEKEINIPASVITGKTFADLNISDPTTDKIEAALRLVFETKQPHEVEFKNHILPDSRYYFAQFVPEFDESGEVVTVLMVSLNISKLKHTEFELRRALNEIKQLQEFLPICSYCKKIRDDENYWQTVEKYISSHTNSKFSHGICPDCFDTELKPQMEARKIKITGQK